MTINDLIAKSDIFRCSVCQKADLFPLEPPVVLCNHCQSILQVPAVVPCPKCNGSDSELIGALDADSQRTTDEGGDKFAALVMFGPLGHAAVDLAPGFREKMAGIKRAFTGAGAYFSCKQCKEHWAILLPTTRACLYAPDPGSRRDAALAFGQGLQVDILQDLTGLIGRLIDLLQDKDELVRAAAAATLGLRGNVLSIPALKAAAINASEATKAVFDQCQTQLRESEAAATAKCKTALGRELKPLEAAVFISWSKHLKGWQFASTFPEIPSRKLTGATGRYAKIGSQEVVVGLIDHTIFGSAKDGFLATTSAFYWNYVGPVKSGHIVYREIEPSSVTYDTRTRRLSAGGRGLVDPPDSEGQAIANFLYDVILSLKLESEKGK